MDKLCWKGAYELAKYRKSPKSNQAARKIRRFLLLVLLFVVLWYAAYQYFSRHREFLGILELFLALVFLAYLHRWVHKRTRKRRQILQTRTIDDLINRYTPYEFEHYVADLFKLYGFHTRVTRATNDGGIDIEMRKDGETYVVEVKQYNRNNRVGRDKIQKLDSAARHVQADYAIFVTTSSFTNPAEEYARELDIELIDGKMLFDMIQRAKSVFSGR